MQLAQEMNSSFWNATQSQKSEWRTIIPSNPKIECSKSRELGFTTLPKTRNKQYA